MLQATPHVPTRPGWTTPLAEALAAMTPERAALATFLLVMAGVMAAVAALTGGTIVYSHDDPYIHVAMAERLRAGHYGINPGEVTSPSSSVLWPFLLLPGAGTPLHVHLPLLWNTLLGGATALLLGRVAATLPLAAAGTGTFGVACGSERMLRIVLACLLVLACNLVGLAWTGLEHNLQVLIAAAVALALIGHARGGPLPTWALALAALGPAVRYELFAVTAAVVIVLLLEQRWRTLLAVGGASVVLPGLLAMFLVVNGNYPLPNSVVTKLVSHSVAAKAATGGAAGVAGAAGTEAAGAAAAPLGPLGMVQLALGRLWLSSFGGKLVMLGVLAILVWCWLPATGLRRVVLSGALAAAALHMGLGQFGWFYRYEMYAVVFCGLLAIWALAERAPRLVPWLVAATALAYLPPVFKTPAGALNVYLQQYQMHRFVAGHWGKPFAVNDLGWVSVGLGRGSYVLDLWGLASNEAVRQKDKTPAWLDDITRRHGTGLAMIYGSYFPAVPASWRKVGELRFAGEPVTVAQSTVQLFATAVGDKGEIAAALTAFAPTLPSGATFVPAPRAEVPAHQPSDAQ